MLVLLPWIFGGFAVAVATARAFDEPDDVCSRPAAVCVGGPWSGVVAPSTSTLMSSLRCLTDPPVREACYNAISIGLNGEVYYFWLWEEWSVDDLVAVVNGVLALGFV